MPSGPFGTKPSLVRRPDRRRADGRCDRRRDAVQRASLHALYAARRDDHAGAPALEACEPWSRVALAPPAVVPG